MEKAKVEGQEFDLLKQEINFDERSWQVYLRKISEYDLRVLHLKDEWMHKRYEGVKQASQAFLDKRATILCYPEKFSPGTALEKVQEIKKESEQLMKQLNCQRLATGLALFLGNGFKFLLCFYCAYTSIL